MGSDDETSAKTSSAAPKFPDMSLDAPLFASTKDRDWPDRRAGQDGE